MSLVELKNVCKTYETGQIGLQVFSDISFSVEEGDCVVITGESGCGKSTLLNLIGGLDNVTEGSVFSCGYEIDKLSEKALTAYRRKSIGFVFQFHYLLKEFNALENIMLPALMAGNPRSKSKGRAVELIKAVGLSDRADHYPSQLSGGERQRIALARSLVNQPRLVLADEPTGNLDEKNSRIVEEILFNLVKDFGVTLLLVTHDAHLSDSGNRRFHLTGKELHQS